MVFLDCDPTCRYKDVQLAAPVPAIYKVIEGRNNHPFKSYKPWNNYQPHSISR
jgi:hypothetical protein